MTNGICADDIIRDSPDSYNNIEHPNRICSLKTTLAFVKGGTSLLPHSLSIVKLRRDRPRRLLF